METLLIVLQVVVGVGILNVWLVRRKMSTPFRGGGAKNMTEEFKEYGLPAWSVVVVGAAKVGLALMILSGFFYPSMTALGSTALGAFMFMAVIMHIKVRDSVMKTVPSLLMLIMCIILAVGSTPDIMAIASSL